MSAMTTSAAHAPWRALPGCRTQSQGRHRIRAAISGGSGESPKNTRPAEVFLACVPLVGFEALGAVLGEAYPAQLEHVMVLVRTHDRVDGGGDTSVVVCYDFLPIDPLAPTTAAVLLGGYEVPGDLRARPLRGVPSRRCWKVGTHVVRDCQVAEIKSATGTGTGTPQKRNIDARADAESFQSRYDSRLCLFGDTKNTCVEHAEALIEHLTGNEIRYEDLIRTPCNANVK